MRVFTCQPLRRCQVNCGNQRMRKRVLLHRAGSFVTICCFDGLFTGMKFSLKNKGELAPVQVVSYQRLESHKREPDRTWHGRKVAPRYDKHVPCFLLFFLDTFQSFTYSSGTKRFCECCFWLKAMLCAIEVFRNNFFRVLAIKEQSQPNVTPWRIFRFNASILVWRMFVFIYFHLFFNILLDAFFSGSLMDNPPKPTDHTDAIW